MVGRGLAGREGLLRPRGRADVTGKDKRSCSVPEIRSSSARAKPAPSPTTPVSRRPCSSSSTGRGNNAGGGGRPTHQSHHRGAGVRRREDGKISASSPSNWTTDAPSWSIEARGRPSPRRERPPVPLDRRAEIDHLLARRVLTPLKRVDFDPRRVTGDRRNTQNRGVSGYEPISWDEALDLVAGEIIRLKREVGPAAILSAPARTTCGATSATGTAPTPAS